jgi:hypothetical protein
MRVHYDTETKEVVNLDNAAVIGHVVRRARVAAGTAGAKHDRGTLAAGTRKHFWTAVPFQAGIRMAWWRPGDGESIGTRFATAQDGVVALTAYAEHFQGSAAAGWKVERKLRWGF